MVVPEWITVSEASRQLGIAERTVRDRISKGKLSAKKDGNRWLIDADSLRQSGRQAADASAKSAIQNTIAVPLDRYEALITRVAQLEVENQEYRLMLEDKRRRPWYRRVLGKGRKLEDETG